MSSEQPDIGAGYRRCRQRLSDLLLAGPPEAWSQPVPACPGWDVTAVVSHLVGNIEDGMAGRLTGPPDDAQSGDQVARHAAQPPVELVGNWDELAGIFEPIVTETQMYPVVLDVLAHEHDIRGAIGAPGERDEALVGLAARLLVSGLELPVNLEFDVGDEVITTVPVDGPTHRVTTTPFEVFRLRLGRRSPEQVAALPWDTVPGPVIDDLFIFGPRTTPLIE